jgi:hypothetical protein
MTLSNAPHYGHFQIPIHVGRRLRHSVHTPRPPISELLHRVSRMRLRRWCRFAAEKRVEICTAVFETDVRKKL